ncbi:MAG: FtsX-like permease family protein [Acidobacteria bacterium]|nr:FtsX-like permease family protein [Acidobacteriota bacterium]
MTRGYNGAGAMLALVLKNLLRNPRRTVLTALSVTLATLLLGVLLSVYAAFYLRQGYQEQGIRLIVRHKVSYFVPMPQYYEDQIARVDGVEEVCIFDYFGGTYIDRRPEHQIPLSAVEPQKIFRVRTESIVAPEQLQAFQQDRQGMAVGASLAQRVGLTLGQRIIIQGDRYPVDLELHVRAIYEGPDDIEAYYHWEYLQESLPQELKGQAMVFSVRIDSPADAGRISREIDEHFRNAPAPTRTETEKAFFLAFISQIGDVKTFILSVALAVAFTLLLVTGNSIAMTVRERTRESAVLRTLGFPGPLVAALIVAEAAATAAAGGALGVALALGASAAMRGASYSFLQGFGLPSWGGPACLAAGIGLAGAAAAPPALRAARMEIVKALRRQD